MRKEKKELYILEYWLIKKQMNLTSPKYSINMVKPKKGQSQIRDNNLDKAIKKNYFKGQNSIRQLIKIKMKIH